MSPSRLLVSPRSACVLLVASGLVAARSFRHAIEIEPPAHLPAPRLDSMPVPGTAAETPVARLAAAVGRDPFHPARHRPAVRFRLPGEALPSDSATRAPAAATPFLLIGTAVMSEGGGFAMCQWGNDAPKLVRVGERVGDLTLKLVARGQATFVDAGGRTLEVRVPKAGT